MPYVLGLVALVLLYGVISGIFYSRFCRRVRALGYRRIKKDACVTLIPGSGYSLAGMWFAERDGSEHHIVIYHRPFRPWLLYLTVDDVDVELPDVPRVRVIRQVTPARAQTYAKEENMTGSESSNTRDVTYRG